MRVSDTTDKRSDLRSLRLSVSDAIAYAFDTQPNSLWISPKTVHSSLVQDTLLSK